MGVRYCMYCGMPIPRKAKICPECGNSLKAAAPKPASPRIAPAGRSDRRKHTPNKKASLAAVSLIAVTCAAFIIILNAGKKIENARSRHRENVMDAERKETHLKIDMPEFSMPDISIPDLQLPEPPAAEFAVESYAVETDLMGNTVLYVNISYTNKAETQECFMTNFHITVQQDGGTCRQTAGDPTRENHLTDSVQPDETALISEAFIIEPEKKTTVSLRAFFGADNYLEEIVLPHEDGTVTVRE